MQEDIIIQITAKLKDIRKDKNITLQELAQSTGVTKGMLSQVENNRTIPSLTVFLNIVKALQIDINDFFQNFVTEAKNKKVIFKKSNDYVSFEKENTIGFRYKRILSVTEEDYHIDCVLLELEPGSKRELVQTNAFEFKYLLAGNIEYTIGKETYFMEAGDSIFLMLQNFTILKTLARLMPYYLFYISLKKQTKTLTSLVFVYFKLIS